MITVYEKEVELTFDNGRESGYINFELNDKSLVLTSTQKYGFVGEEIQIVQTIDHEDGITLLEEALSMLKLKLGY